MGVYVTGPSVSDLPQLVAIGVRLVSVAPSRHRPQELRGALGVVDMFDCPEADGLSLQDGWLPQLRVIHWNRSLKLCNLEIRLLPSILP